MNAVIIIVQIKAGLLRKIPLVTIYTTNCTDDIHFAFSDFVDWGSRVSSVSLFFRIIETVVDTVELLKHVLLHRQSCFTGVKVHGKK